MRESRTFAERTKLSESDRTLKKYFLVYEGSDTEQIYFDAVNSMRIEIGINPLIELVPLIRSYSEVGWSNPKKIVDRIISNLKESKTGNIKYETLLNMIMVYLQEEKIISTSKTEAKSIWQTLSWICHEKLAKTLNANVVNTEADAKTIIDLLQKETELVNVVADISDIIKRSEITYNEDIDKICLVVDRDRKSFVANPDNNQYQYVLNRCAENNFGFFITNPCFEFWLLLHFEEVHELDREELLENRRVNSKRRYAENELRNIFPKYAKTSYHAEDLVKRIDVAIKNEKVFCEDREKLENQIGSNIGLLIQEMRR